MTSGGDSRAPEKIQEELDRTLFHIRTLYDVSRELLGVTEVRTTVRNFLLMTMGNFGATHGFILTEDSSIDDRSCFEPVGFPESDHRSLREAVSQLLLKTKPTGVTLLEETLRGAKSSTPDMVCLFTFKVEEGCAGMMGLGPKLVGENYTEDDKELLATLVNHLVSSLKSARYAEALKTALEEVKTLNSAKDKVINHLSHELVTPVALLGGCLLQLERKLAVVPAEVWQKTMQRANRGLARLSDIRHEVQDIMIGNDVAVYHSMSSLLDLCACELEQLAAEEVGEERVTERIRDRIEGLFGPKESEPEDLYLERFVMQRLEEIKPLFTHRQVEVITVMEKRGVVRMPPGPLEKVIVGLIKNAVENTPDEGKIEVAVRNRGNGVEVVVRDYGVGIRPEHQKRIFEGFFPTQETLLYSSKNPFDFNAGGRGADLLRMKIFSERIGFKLSMTSSRCKFLSPEGDICPGRISRCGHCSGAGDCYGAGGTTFRVLFPSGNPT